MTTVSLNTDRPQKAPDVRQALDGALEHFGREGLDAAEAQPRDLSTARGEPQQRVRRDTVQGAHVEAPQRAAVRRGDQRDTAVGHFVAVAQVEHFDRRAAAHEPGVREGGQENQNMDT